MVNFYVFFGEISLQSNVIQHKTSVPLMQKYEEEIHVVQSTEKKGFIEKIKSDHQDKTSVPIQKGEETHVVQSKEKKGIIEKIKDKLHDSPIEKIKEKLPGHHKKAEEVHAAHPPTPAVVAHAHEGEHKEKKGIFEKIKDKIPGHHPKSEEQKKGKWNGKEKGRAFVTWLRGRGSGMIEFDYLYHMQMQMEKDKQMGLWVYITFSFFWLLFVCLFFFCALK